MISLKSLGLFMCVLYLVHASDNSSEIIANDNDSLIQRKLYSDDCVELAQLVTIKAREMRKVAKAKNMLETNVNLMKEKVNRAVELKNQIEQDIKNKEQALVKIEFLLEELRGKIHALQLRREELEALFEKEIESHRLSTISNIQEINDGWKKVENGPSDAATKESIISLKQQIEALTEAIDAKKRKQQLLQSTQKNAKAENDILEKYIVKYRVTSRQYHDDNIKLRNQMHKFIVTDDSYKLQQLENDNIALQNYINQITTKSTNVRVATF